jgi:DNA invertase Pin-like site-specific DNA recombinase
MGKGQIGTDRGADRLCAGIDRRAEAGAPARSLNAAGCERTFDHASGAKTDRSGLAEALAYLRAGDTLVVWKLDQLGRSMSHLIEKVGELAARGVGCRSLTEQIDTTTSGGLLVFNIFGSLAQFERDLIRERTNAGLKAAQERGVGGLAVDVRSSA